MFLKHVSPLLALLLSVPGEAPRAAAPVASPCAQAPLFQRYARSGMVESLPGNKVRLTAVADVHSEDCGAPDCYFTRVRAVFHFAEGEGCQVREVKVSTEDGGCRPQGERAPKRQEAFFPKGPADVADPALAQLTLHTRKADRALILLPKNLFYFEDVKPGASLHTTLPTGEAGEDACCWGASIAEPHFRD
ncbi:MULTISPECIES: hypothetical protein [unclassified Corallococcus]|uniref:hypothetical protein n=1 Tax=unclassified Corallococcus TaxID=2685029 RepID=UPI001A90C2D9|nr:MULTISPECIES: hypothetical protein [unclassified Corallococcus]MBN9686185.1 hypothetical protein [Corallococcus sp. NCSPR001]WAS82383.1 hypothetical protein O0N60_23995 [Corallococcus sp. NCRR]